MTETLHLLMVEDSEDDANLILRQIAEAGFIVDSQRVENATQMQVALEAQRWDLVTSDLSLPQFDPFSALALLKKSRVDIPLIIISGEINETQGIALMKAGAHDFLSKDNLARLGVVLKRELTFVWEHREKFESENPSKNGMSFHKTDEELQRLNRIYAFTSQVNKMVLRTHDLQKLYKGVCRIAVEVGQFRMAWIGLVDDVTRVVNPLCWSGYEEGYLKAIRQITLDLQPTGLGPTATAIRRRWTVTSNDIAKDPIMVPWRGEALRRGYRSSIALPLTIKEKVVGAFTLYNSEAYFFNSDEIALLETVTSDIAFAVEKIENEEKRSHAEEALHRSEERSRLLVDESPIGVLVLDHNGMITAWNRAQEKIYGRPAVEAIGKPGWEVQLLFLPDRAKTSETEESLKKYIMTVLKTGEIPENLKRMETELHLLDGSRRWVEISVFVTRTEAGNNSVTSTQDITERKLAEAALRHSEETYKAILQTALDGYLLVDLQGRILDVNETYCSISGYSREELLALSVPDLEAGENPDAVAARIQKILGSGVDRFESVHRRKDGRLFDAEVSVKYYPAEGGRIVSFIRDISERKRADALLTRRD